MNAERRGPAPVAAHDSLAYPDTPDARSRWVLATREPRGAAPSPWKPAAVFVEPERTADGAVADTAAVLLVNRECPWRCVYCDLWKQTLPGPTPPGAISAQVDLALQHPACARATQIKLYNAGSFFDAGAVPPRELPEIARRLRRFARVIVECHPALIGPRVFQFRDALAPAQLEVAMGLEIAHPEVLSRLNKRLTLEVYAAACARLAAEGVDIRAFVMVQPPFLPPAQSVDWAARSVAFAVEHGAAAVCLIPTRLTHGPMQRLAEHGWFSAPALETLEEAWAVSLPAARGRRLLADTWDLQKFSRCPHCWERRAARLQRMNLEQTLLPRTPACPACGWGRD
jgi:radical SAM enzyme (TIGR01210 family)